MGQVQVIDQAALYYGKYMWDDSCGTHEMKIKGG